MVLSASSVFSYETTTATRYAVVKRQLIWVLLGLPWRALASRLPTRLIRRLA